MRRNEGPASRWAFRVFTTSATSLCDVYLYIVRDLDRSWSDGDLTMTRMVRKQLYIDERQDALLKAESARTGETESALIRRAIDSAYDPEAARIEGEARVARFNSAVEALAEVINQSGEPIAHMSREEIYRRGRSR